MSQEMNLKEKVEQGSLGVGKAIMLGHLLVNVPVVVIMASGFVCGKILLGSLWWVLFIAGFLIAWLWWAYTVPRWRKWALQKGAPVQKLHEMAVITGLEWPKGTIFEKTEMKVKE